MTAVKRAGRPAGPGRVEVDGRVLETERVVVATGSDQKLPPIDGLDEAGYWTNREATTVSRVPGRLVVLGGGATGIELGPALRRYGAEVTSSSRGTGCCPGRTRA